MDSITKPIIKIDSYELIDSQVISLFGNEFMVYFDNIGFNFLFFDNSSEKAFADIEKLQDGDFYLYKIKIYNLNSGKVQGSFKPLTIGKDNEFAYHYSLTGIAKEGGGDKIVVFNLYREAIK